MLLTSSMLSKVARSWKFFLQYCWALSHVRPLPTMWYVLSGKRELQLKPKPEERERRRTNAAGAEKWNTKTTFSKNVRQQKFRSVTKTNLGGLVGGWVGICWTCHMWVFVSFSAQCWSRIHNNNVLVPTRREEHQNHTTIHLKGHCRARRTEVNNTHKLPRLRLIL